MVNVVSAYDLDGVVINFNGSFLPLAKRLAPELNWPENIHSIPSFDYGLTREEFWDVFKEVRKDDQFWLNLYPLATERERLMMNPDYYITARPISSEITIEYLQVNGFPPAPVHTVSDKTHNKKDMIRELGVDYMLEDRFQTFVELNEETDATCFLVNRPYNIKESCSEFSHLRLGYDGPDNTRLGEGAIREYENILHFVGKKPVVPYGA